MVPKLVMTIELMSKISSMVNIPVIASGGVGNLDHLVDGIKLGNASAVLAASIFHYGKHSVKKLGVFGSKRNSC